VYVCWEWGCLRVLRVWLRFGLKVIARFYDGVAHLVARLKVYIRLGNLVRDDHDL